MPRTVVIVSVDAEVDNWVPKRDALTVENAHQLPHLQEFFDRLGCPVTYFTAYRLASDPLVADVLRSLWATGRAEIAAHLHPWSTPPFGEPLHPTNTMLKNLPADLQRAKLRTLTAALEEVLGRRPRAFRAGRYGLGRETVGVLIEEGYRVDSSVTPWISWLNTDNGADFVGAPEGAYCLDGSTDPREPVPNGPLLEIPVSCGYTRAPFKTWHSALERLRLPPLRRLRLAGLAARLGVVRAVTLSPEASSARNMLRLARCLVAQGVPHLSLFVHSPSLIPGLSPFVRTQADLHRLYASLAEFISGLDRFTTPVLETISRAAELLRPGIRV